MPFVQRVIEPKFLSHTSLFDADGKPRVTDDELEAVTNNTLSNALRQLASLAVIANDIFVELTKQLQNVTRRSDNLKGKIGVLEQKVTSFDPKKVSVRSNASDVLISEEAQEARNKNIKRYREGFSRKSSRKKTNQDIFNMLLVTSDPLISSLRKLPTKKHKNFSPEAVEMFLPASTRDDSIDSSAQSSSDSDED